MYMWLYIFTAYWELAFSKQAPRAFNWLKTSVPRHPMNQISAQGALAENPGTGCVCFLIWGNARTQES